MAESQRLREYREKRAFGKTPEPRGGDGHAEHRDRFVIQEHHARRLHWDLRLEYDGVLVSWALPRGLPDDPDQNRLAVHTEDHPLEYLTFEGEIPKGEYGAGTMTIWDHGTYTAEKFEERKVVVELHGERVHGKYALFRTQDDWLIHRMDPPESGTEPMPRDLEPMKATLSELPPDDDAWAFEVKWDGIRALAYVETGSLRLVSRTGRDVTRQYPEIAPLARQVGARRVVLDGELVAFDDEGKPSFQRLQPRIHVASEAKVRQRQRESPVTYVIFDLLYLDGQSVMAQPYTERRKELAALGLDGAYWQAPDYHRGDGAALLDATREQGVEGVIAKRLDSRYQPGRRSRDWLKVKNVYRQEMVIGGWTPGTGSRSTSLGALLVGYYDGDDLRYAGKVGTGFDARTLRELQGLLEPLQRDESPFTGRQPQKDSVFVEPELVCDVEFRQWTTSGTLRQPSYQGLRDDKPPRDVVREKPAPPPAQTEEPAGDAKDDEQSAESLSEGKVTIEGRQLKLSNLDKVFYPHDSITKGQVLEYYLALAPAVLPHLEDRPLTLKRYPDGVDGEHFFEKRCPPWRPDWVTTAAIYSERNRAEIEYCVVNDLPTLMWAANLANLELHTMLARMDAVERPTMVVFDLDPGEGAGLTECAGVAAWLRDLFGHLGLEVLVKSSGSKGLHLAVPLNTDVTYDDTKPFAHAVAQLAEKERSDVVSRMTKARRRGKVLVDWSQNTSHKTTVAPFSLRARERPTVSAPLSWSEVGAVADGDAAAESLLLDVDQVLDDLDGRIALFRPLLETRQALPDLGG